MTMRDLGRRLTRLEEDVPVGRGRRIDPATLTSGQLEVLEHVPSLQDGDIDFGNASEADLRVIASIRIPNDEVAAV